MKIINSKKDKLVFSAEMSNSLANSIKRYVHQIPTVAVDYVEISKNDSALYDETIAHRIGLIPLKAKKQTGELKLKTKKEGMVYAGDLKGDAEIVYEKIPITLLDKEKEINLKAILGVGKGSDHAKFCPGLMLFRNEFEIKMNKKFKEQIQKIFPELEIKEKGDKIIFLDDKEREISDVCSGLDENIEITETANLIIDLESFGQLKVENIFKKAIEQLKKDLNDFSKKIK